MNSFENIKQDKWCYVHTKPDTKPKNLILPKNFVQNNSKPNRLVLRQ